jgi:hypothetical protein
MVLGLRQLFKRQQTPVFCVSIPAFFMNEILPPIVAENQKLYGTVCHSERSEKSGQWACEILRYTMFRSE